MSDDLSHLWELSLSSLGDMTKIALGRCPSCFTYYLIKGVSDHDHWYSYEVYVEPLSADKARQWLTRLDTDPARQWLTDLEA